MKSHPDHGRIANLDPEFLRRAFAYVEGVLPDDELNLLERELSEDSLKRQALVRLSLTCAGMSEELRRNSASKAAPGSFLGLLEADQPLLTGDMNDAMVFRAITDVDVAIPSDDGIVRLAAPAEPALPIEQARSPRASAPYRFSPRIWGIAAALLVVITIAAVITLRSSPVTRITATAAASWADTNGHALGAALKIGDVLTLQKGGAELTFASGATVVLEGPATLRLVDPLHAVLESGKLVAHVPESAHGFTVTHGDLSVVDLGTEFGLRIDAAGDAYVEVFEGQVTVKSASENAVTSSLHLVAGDVLHCDAKSKNMQQVTAVPVPFVTDLSQIQLPLGVFNTGVRLRPGATDPNWQVVAASDDPKFVAGPAAVVQPVTGHTATAGYRKNEADLSQWISTGTGPDVPSVPQGTYTFRTTLNIPPDLDPQTVRLDAKVMADDYIQEVRINGKSFDPEMDHDISHFIAGQQMTLDRGFVSGNNVIEFVVFNRLTPPARLSSMAFRLEWTGTAAATIVRAAP